MCIKCIYLCGFCTCIVTQLLLKLEEVQMQKENILFTVRVPLVKADAVVTCSSVWTYVVAAGKGNVMLIEFYWK